MEGSISEKVSCVDLFCGAGGLTHGFVLEGLPVVAGIDLDPACRFPYEANNQARFVERDVGKVTIPELKALFGDADLTILAGCAPCQPFSTYAQRYKPVWPYGVGQASPDHDHAVLRLRQWPFRTPGTGSGNLLERGRNSPELSARLRLRAG